MLARRASAVAVVVGLLVAGCSLGSDAVRPADPNFQMIGQLSGLQEFEDSTMYTLADGRTWTERNDRFRVYDKAGGRTLFVSGQDKGGRYVVLIGSQQGLPDDCLYALRYGGRDWGDAIESQGFVWHKSPAFKGLASTPAVGADYPDDTVFCLDDGAHVTAVLQVTGAGGAPQQSATAP